MTDLAGLGSRAGRIRPVVPLGGAFGSVADLAGLGGRAGRIRPVVALGGAFSDMADLAGLGSRAGSVGPVVALGRSRFGFLLAAVRACIDCNTIGKAGCSYTCQLVVMLAGILRQSRSI